MASLYTRELGRSEIKVSSIGLGTWAIGGPFSDPSGTPSGWGEVDDKESLRGIQRAFDLGITFFDTADIYGTGHAEVLLGKALADKRDQVVLASKFGCTFEPGSRKMTSVDASPAYIRSALEGTLSRLQTDYLDLYQFHLGDYDLAQAAIARDTLEELVEEGKIRSYGWSTDKAENAALFAEGFNCTAIQQQLNLFGGNAEIISICEDQNLASINRGPLAMGLLTGKFSTGDVLPDDDVRKSADWSGSFKGGQPNPAYLDKLDLIKEVLTSNGRSLTQGALAWIWARSPNTLPIPGFRTVAQVEENAKAMEFGPLTAVQMQEIELLMS